VIKGSSLQHPAFLAAGIVLFIFCAYLAEKHLDKWRESTGRAPNISGNRRGRSIARQQLLHEAPIELRRQVHFLDGLGVALMVVGLLTAIW